MRLGLRLGGSSSLISSIVRPVRTEQSSCSSMFQAESSAASLCLIINHSLPFSLCFNFTKTKLPRSFSPFRLLPGVEVAFYCVSAAVPNHHRSRAIVAFGDFALKAAILERMIFHVNGEAFVGVALGRSLGHSPGLQRPIDRQPEIVVQPRCR